MDGIGVAVPILFVDCLFHHTWIVKEIHLVPSSHHHKFAGRFLPKMEGGGAIFSQDAFDIFEIWSTDD